MVGTQYNIAIRFNELLDFSEVDNIGIMNPEKGIDRQELIYFL
jgi:hypothetical protein